MDEIFETATLLQTGKIATFPLVLMGREYWQPLVDFVRGTMVARGTVSAADLDLILLTDSPDEAMAAIEHFAREHAHLRLQPRRRLAARRAARAARARAGGPVSRHRTLEPVLEALRAELGGQIVAENRAAARAGALRVAGSAAPGGLERALAAAGSSGSGATRRARSRPRGRARRAAHHRDGVGQVDGLPAPGARGALAAVRGARSGSSRSRRSARTSAPSSRRWRGPAGADDGRCRIAIYDGDTPDVERARIRREPPRVLITTPTCCTSGSSRTRAPGRPSSPSSPGSCSTSCTPTAASSAATCTTSWRGCSGSRARSARPSFVAASATAAEADGFAAAIAVGPSSGLRESGAPREAREFLLVRPSASPYTAALDVLEILLERGQKTIVFTKARRITSCSSPGSSGARRRWRGGCAATGRASCPASGGASSRTSRAAGSTA